MRGECEGERVRGRGVRGGEERVRGGEESVRGIGECEGGEESACEGLG